MLDVGCGGGRHTVEMCHWECRAVGVDLSRDDLKLAKLLIGYEKRDLGTVGRADFAAADVEHLPFRDELFDKIVCTEVLEHIPDDKAGLRELIRVLKPGGLIAVSVPAYLPEITMWTISWQYWHSPGGHIRFYRPGEMLAALRQNGLDVYAQRRRHSLQTFYWFVRCAFGIRNQNFLVRFVERVIKLIYWRRLRTVEYLEALTNPFMGKDLVFYARKPDGPAEGS